MSDKPLDPVPPSAPIPSPVIENEQIYTAFENSIVQRVNQRLDEKLARRQATYIAAVAIIITVITAVGGYVGNLVLELQVNKQVREQLQQEAGQIVQQAEYLLLVGTLENRLRQIDAAEGVNPSQLERAIDEFETLHLRFVTPGLLKNDQENADLDVTSTEAVARQTARTREAQLTVSFDLLVQILSSVDRLEDVLKLSEIVPGMALDSTIAVQALSQSYGRQVVGVAGAPDTWAVGEPYHEAFLSYRSWSTRARQSNYPELFYLFEALVWHIEGRTPADIEDILRDIDSLNELDGSVYEALLLDLAQEAFVTTPTAHSGRIAERAQDFITTYADASVRVANVSEALSD